MDWQRIFTSLKNKKVAVIGDIIGDIYISTQPSRISREAPVLILDYQGERMVPGGAANVAMNLHALGLQVSLLGWLGNDEAGERISKELKQVGINGQEMVFRDAETITKTRILAGGQSQLIKQQVLRLDRGQPLKIDASFAEDMSKGLKGFINEMDAIIFSDYGYGTVIKETIGEVLSFKKDKPLFLAGDSRNNLAYYANFDILTPNEVEAKQYSAAQRIEDAGADILRALNPQALLITRGGLGMALLQRNISPKYIPPCGFTPIADVSGAGDTVLAAITAARLLNIDWYEAAIFASLAAAVVVRKAGTALAFPEEIKEMGEREAAKNDLDSKRKNQ